MYSIYCMHTLFNKKFGLNGKFMKREKFILGYLIKTKNKILTTEILKEAYVDTFHVGDSFMLMEEKSVILGFDEFGAWLVKESALKDNSIKTRALNCIPYPLLVSQYYASAYKYTKIDYKISEVDLVKYKMLYGFLRHLQFIPCLDETDYFESYLNKSAFQIVCKSIVEKISSGLIHGGFGLFHLKG